MKKHVVGIFFALVLCLAMVPISAFAAGKTAIRTVDELMQFAADVNAGAYDGKTDAVVSLEAPTTTLTFRIFSAENFTATDIRFLIWTFPMPMA